MARGKKAINRRKPAAGGRRPYLALVVVLALILLALFLLERTRKAETTQTTRQGTPRPQPLPQRIPLPELKEQKPVLPEVPQLPTTEGKPGEIPPLVPVKGRGSLAIIVDDMGSSVQEAKELLSIDLPITFAVIPSLGKASQVAEAAHAAGAQVMVHMPMEPQGYPKQRLESIGLLVSMDDAEIQKRVAGYFSLVPHAVGANNHMGSRFTEQVDKMVPVLKVLKDRGVFFVDSMTSPASVGYRTARAAGVPSAARQVFLDNVQDVAAIRRQLAQAAAIASKRGSAIAIGHPHPATIRALKEMMPELKKGGIVLVHASKLVG